LGPAANLGYSALDVKSTAEVHMSQFAILVTITLKPGSAEEFKPHILANAKAAVRDEADCHQFNVLQSEDDPDTFFFYEVYTDSAALDVHRETPHYKKFSADAGHLVAERVIQRTTVVDI
jgi:autoinducer 2-degrading protein